MEAVAFDRLAALAAALFLIGALGVVWRRNLLVQLLSLQLQFGGAQLLLVAFGRRVPAPVHEAEAQAFALLALAVGVLQLVVGFAVVIALARHRDSLDVEDASALRW
jgi:NADH-quinone oxidoreductase subunit K